MNPFVEFLRAAIEMVVQSFSYESVFRYLRCYFESGAARRQMRWKTMFWHLASAG